jgi:hypothetical protein
VKGTGKGPFLNKIINKLRRPFLFDHFTGGVNKPAQEANEIIHQWLLK